jgi:hypothetical protein
MFGRPKEGIMSPGRPSLDEVLNNTAPQPYTLAAYTAFLSQQHCLETLEFTIEAKKYADKYDEVAAHLVGMPITVDAEEGYELTQDWLRIMDIYVKPGAPREINLPSEERDDLVETPYEPRPPQPEALDAAVKRMYDLMSDSIFIPFCNSLKVPSYAQTFNAMSDYAMTDDLDQVRLTFDERSMHRRVPSRRRSPPNTSAGTFEHSRSPPNHHRSTQSSSLSSALGRQGNRLSTHISHSSAVSESALTDSSGGLDSPPGEEAEMSVTPPTTPPMSDLPAGGNGHKSQHHQSSGTSSSSAHAPKTQRSESGGWKKMGLKIFGGTKKKSSSFTEER